MKQITLLFLCLAGAQFMNAQPTLYYNGRIFTGDSAASTTDYFVVENGRITKTGTGLSLGDRENYSNQVNLNNKTVIPGIIDSHIHFIDGGLGLLQTSFFNIHTKEELIKKIRSAENDLLDGMFIGRDLGYEPLTGIASPKNLLDELMPTTPTILFMKSGHAAVANSAALRKFGFKKGMQIEDGTIQSDASGNATGFLMEGAAMAANQIISSFYTSETIQRAIAKAQSLALSYGITTIGDNTFSPYFFKIYQELQKNNLLKIRVRARSYGRIPQTEGLMKGVGKKHLGFIGGGVDYDRVSYHAMKFFEDQSLSPTPAHSREAIEPGGKIFLDEQKLNEILQLHPGSTLAFHVQGKRGVQNILNVVGSNPAYHQRHILDHAGYTSAEQLQDAARLQLGVTIIAGQVFDYKNLVSVYKSQPSGDFIERDLLNTRAKFFHARAALTSDYPYGMDTLFANYPEINGLNPFPMMAVNVTGKYPDGSLIRGMEDKTLSVDEALEAFTTHGAFVLHEDHRLGKIAPGYFADFVVLENGITADSSFDLYRVKVSKTYINGELVYDSRNQFAANAKFQRKVHVSPTDYALSPVIGYDPTVGMIFGGAFFKFPLKTPGRYFDAQLQSISGGKLNAQGTYTYFDLFRNVNLSIAGSYSNFFQYYFGEGNKTEARSYSKLFNNTYRVKSELQMNLKNNIRAIFFADVRGRRETQATDKNGIDLNKTFFPNENSIAMGFSFQHDTRDNAFSTRTGVLKQISAQYIPAAWNVGGLGDVTQVTAELRHFRYLGNSNFVIASRLAAGFSHGSPSYLFRYSLGGAYALRGYYSNRFRGEKFYVGQIEARFPLYKRFSGAVFFDAGDVTDQDFVKPKCTYGAGLRFGLSPNIKLRLDYGVAKDQTGVFFTFSEAF